MIESAYKPLAAPASGMVIASPRTAPSPRRLLMRTSGTGRRTSACGRFLLTGSLHPSWHPKNGAAAMVRRMLLPAPMACPAAVSYRPRDSRTSPLYQLVADHADELRQVYDQSFAATYGPWQAHWTGTLEKFRRCGDLHFGFARIYCRTCRHTFLTALSCGCRTFCPSCEARRRALFTEHGGFIK